MLFFEKSSNRHKDKPGNEDFWLPYIETKQEVLPDKKCMGCMQLKNLIYHLRHT